MAFKKRLKFNKKLRLKKEMGVLYLLIFLLSLGIGYAYIGSGLSINGSTKIAGATWDVHFDNLNVTTGSVEAETPASITDTTTVEFSAQLEEPTNYYEFTVDIVNGGTMNAKIDELKILPQLTEDEKKYLDYQVKYTTDIDVQENDILLAGRTRTILVSFKYIENEDTSLYPTEDKIYDFTINLDYAQLPNDYNPCTYDGEMTDKATYINGQYKYVYNESTKGWAVSLNDNDSTDPVTTHLCTSINGKPIVSMAGMFYNSKTESVDLSSFDTSNVTDMSGMFVSTQVQELDFSSFDTSKVKNMSSMFMNNQNLASIDLSNFNTSNVTSLSQMFLGCTSLKKLDLSNFDTSNVVGMGGLTSGASQLEELNVSGWDFRKVPSSSGTIAGFLVGNPGNSNVKKLNLSNAKFGDNLERAFASFSNLEELDLTNVDTSMATNMYSMFNGCSSLKSLDLSSFDTSKVTNMSAMFLNCSYLTRLDLSNFDTGNVTSMGSLLSGATNLEELNVSGWDFRKAGNIHDGIILPSYVPAIKKMNFSNCKFGESMEYAFSNFGTLESLDLSGVDTSQTTKMAGTFQYLNLSTVDISDFDMENVETMVGMFRNSAIEKIDFTGMNTEKVTTMAQLATSCQNLKEVILDNCGSDNLTAIYDMFYGANAIEKISMKNFNFGTSTTYGGGQSPFINKTNVKTIDLSGAKMAKASSFHYAFYHCENLETLNLSNIYAPTPITTAYDMFNGDSKLSVIDLSSFDFSQVTSYSNMFSGVTATVGYAKTQADADILNASSDKPSTLVFTVKN